VAEIVNDAKGALGSGIQAAERAGGHGARLKPLKARVTEILRNEILSGRLPPGAILNERELAKQLGVSKTPVRESLSLLDHEGLVATIPRKGYYVSPITVKDVHNCFGLRLILECAAAEMAAAKVTDEQIEQLALLVPDRSPTDGMGERLDRNLEFHCFIAELSGNDRLAALIKKLLREMGRMIAAGFVLAEHEKVMLAFRVRDPRAAATAMRDHICAVRDNALRMATTPPLEHPDAPR
jgi:DNA-binding GntR family transcriptional regulator